MSVRLCSFVGSWIASHVYIPTCRRCSLSAYTWEPINAHVPFSQPQHWAAMCECIPQPLPLLWRTVWRRSRRKGHRQKDKQVQLLEQRVSVEMDAFIKFIASLFVYRIPGVSVVIKNDFFLAFPCFCILSRHPSCHLPTWTGTQPCSAPYSIPPVIWVNSSDWLYFKFIHIFSVTNLHNVAHITMHKLLNTDLI